MPQSSPPSRSRPAPQSAPHHRPAAGTSDARLPNSRENSIGSQLAHLGLHEFSGLDRESGTDLFLLFSEDFEAPQTFLNDIARRLQEEHALTNDAVGSDASKLPPLPAALLDQRNPPWTRLEAGLGYTHSLVNVRHGQHFLWGLGPGIIGDLESSSSVKKRLGEALSLTHWRVVGRLGGTAAVTRTSPRRSGFGAPPA